MAVSEGLEWGQGGSTSSGCLSQRVTSTSETTQTAPRESRSLNSVVSESQAPNAQQSQWLIAERLRRSRRGHD